ncbi:hypothetical protein QBC36DRAFT_287377 [Triangularia setosa]|uniref:Uncharacterized protein n=1 Tax=Triangularia setosa TaxID=2587417 RepID=A0AAN6WCR9_9PEZI|nr:hypothetical protein QBC36DRAFT_287377 [Podospora setosa]
MASSRPAVDATAPAPAHECGLALTPSDIASATGAFVALVPASLEMIPFTGEEGQLDRLYLTSRKGMYPPSPMVDYTISPAGFPIICPSCRAYFRIFTSPNGIIFPDFGVYGLPRRCAFHRIYNYTINHTSEKPMEIGLVEAGSLDFIENRGYILSPSTEYALVKAIMKRLREPPPVAGPVGAIGKEREPACRPACRPARKRSPAAEMEEMPGLDLSSGAVTDDAPPLSWPSTVVKQNSGETKAPDILNELVAQSIPEERPVGNRNMHSSWPHEDTTEAEPPAALRDLAAASEPEERAGPSRVIHPPWPHEDNTSKDYGPATLRKLVAESEPEERALPNREQNPERKTKSPWQAL